MTRDAYLREQLLELLRGENAHATFDDVVNGFPVAHVGVRPGGAPHSPWEVLEHMRISQYDIVRFSQDPDYVSPKWPDEYWPRQQAPGSEREWRKSTESFRWDRKEFEQLILDPGRDLYEPFPWGDGQTLLREALVLADHTAYHLGQLMLLRRALEKKPD